MKLFSPGAEVRALLPGRFRWKLIMEGAKKAQERHRHPRGQH